MRRIGRYTRARYEPAARRTVNGLHSPALEPCPARSCRETVSMQAKKRLDQSRESDLFSVFGSL